MTGVGDDDDDDDENGETDDDPIRERGRNTERSAVPDTRVVYGLPDPTQPPFRFCSTPLRPIAVSNSGLDQDFRRVRGKGK
jgi:hypothetical protein